MMEFLFLDLDDTILDFHKAERIALSKTLRQFGVEPTGEVLSFFFLSLSFFLFFTLNGAVTLA